MKNTTIVAICTGVLAILLLLNTCRLNRKIDKQSSQITEQQLSNQKLDSIVNKQKQVIYQQDVIITDNQSAIAALTDTIFNLKEKDAKNMKTIAYYQGRNVVTLTGVKVPYLDSAYMKYFEDSIQQHCATVIDYIRDSTVKVGMVAADSTSTYKIQQTVLKDGIRIDNLTIPDTLNLRFVQHKGGLFRKAKIEVQYFHSNPLVKTTGSNSVMYIPRKKSFFTRVILPVAVGIGTGLLIAK